MSPPSLQLCDLSTNSQRAPLGIAPGDVTLGWKLVSDIPGTLQARYRITACDGGKTIWDTGIVDDDRCFAVSWRGPRLASRQQIDWTVQVWDNHGRQAEASSRFETGLSAPEDWCARFIEFADEQNPAERHPAGLFRHQFALNRLPLRARLYATAHGLYEARLNGQRVTDALFTPGFTVYDQRLQVQTYDVTSQLSAGPNVIGALLADGWYRGSHGSHHKTNSFGTQLAFLAQLELTFEDGSTQVIGTGPDWTCGTGSLRFCDLHLGVVVDAAQDAGAWDDAAFDAKHWRPVRVVEHDLSRLRCQEGPLSRVTKEVAAVAVIRTPNGSSVIDFGQNLAGHVRFSARGTRGHEIRMLPVEVLDQQGNPYSGTTVMPEVGKRKYPRHRWIFRLSGNGLDSFDARHTYTGFRYVAVEGWLGELRPGDITACVVHSDVRVMGRIECSDARVNRLLQNIDWTHRSNLVEIPTDCPAREKAGWTGDAFNVVASAVLSRDVHAVLRRWLKDVVVDQDKRGHGIVSCVSPNTRTYQEGIPHLDGSAGWGDAIVKVPWALYEEYGDQQVLAENYPAMLKWIDFCDRRARKVGRATWLVPRRALNPRHWKRNRNLITHGFQFGDWLPPGENLLISMLRNALMTPVFAATALYAFSLGLVATIASLLGHTEDARRMAKRNAEVVGAFREEFLRRDGRLTIDKQYAYVLALAFDLLPEEGRQDAADRLADLVVRNGYRLKTGFISTPYLLPQLTRFGHHEVAGRLLMQDRRPSWLYEVDRGATTVWESWDAIDEQGKVLPASLNHYSLGAASQWLVQHVCGLQATEPGYRSMRIAPQPADGLSYCKVEHETPCGPVRCQWRIDGDTFDLDAYIPPNTRAEIVLPSGERREVGSGRYRFSVPGRARATLLDKRDGSVRPVRLGYRPRREQG